MRKKQFLLQKLQEAEKEDPDFNFDEEILNMTQLPILQIREKLDSQALQIASAPTYNLKEVIKNWRSQLLLPEVKNGLSHLLVKKGAMTKKQFDIKQKEIEARAKTLGETGDLQASFGIPNTCLKRPLALITGEGLESVQIQSPSKGQKNLRKEEEDGFVLRNEKIDVYRQIKASFNVEDKQSLEQKCNVYED